MPGDLVPRETHDAVTGKLQVGALGRVAFVIEARAVKGEAVELDDELVLEPVSVNLVDVLVAVQEDICVRAG